MIEATCSACGTLNRIAEADVPMGAKFVNCTSCKSRVGLPAKGLAALPPPPVPQKGPGSVALGPAGSGGNDDIIDLADVPAPAPRRQSALGPEASRPAPRSGLSSALDELPAPKPRVPAPRALDELAPKPRAPSALDELAPKARAPATSALDELAPKARAPAPLDLDDMMSPVTSPATPSADDGVSDLLAPRGARPPNSRTATPQPNPEDPISDLPTPRGRAATPSTAPRPVPSSISPVIDLPAPRPGGARALTDLPTPKPKTSPPVRPSAPGLPADLPMPRTAAGGSVDLPMPRSAVDLPMPKVGGPGGVDLPAPKGFFDDLPQPAKGGGRPAEQPEVPAPKGFFDDLPQPAKGGGRPTEQPEVPAPKGFFDDLPQKAQPNRAGLPAPVIPGPLTPVGPGPLTPVMPGLPYPVPPGQQVTPLGHEAPAPKGFFDDLPQPSRTKEQSGEPKNAFGSGAIDLGDDPIEPMELALDEPSLELDGPGADIDGPGADIDGPKGGSFDELDLSAPSTPQSRVGAEEAEKAGIKFSAAKPGPPGPPTPDKATLSSFSRPAGNDMALELEEPRQTEKTEKKASRDSGALGPRKKEAPVVDSAALAKQRKRRRNVVAGLALGVALLGGGGFFMYQRHTAQQERAAELNGALVSARTAMSASDASHWQRAAAAANKVIALDHKNAEAYGIAAEASIAGALADGKHAPQRIAQGRKLISDALGAGVTGPQLDRAQLLATLTTSPDKAGARIEALLAKTPKDGSLALYLAWAHAAMNNPAAAIKAYDRAIDTPSVKVPALLGRARAKLLLNDIPGARADFDAVLAVEKENIPAQVGLAATLPASQAQQQESELLAILGLKTIENGDPRAVVQAWVLAADLARKGGRSDAARERYRKALAKDAKDIGAMTGLAEIELRENKTEIAQELITKVLTIAPNDANAQLVQCEISLRKRDITDAENRIKLLGDRLPPLAPLDGARLMLVKGKLHDMRKEDEEAVAAYIAGAKLAGDRDLTPTFAAVAKLAQMAKAAAEANDLAKEAALRARSDELLLTLAELAMKDPALALTLGNAYLQSGDAAKAEPWLRRVIEARPKDADALYLLGKVLRRQGKGADAIDTLVKARELDPKRDEIGLELARTYELTRRDPDAGKLYDTLLQAPEPSLELRGHAGKFFVRTGKLVEAGEQGVKILAVDRQSAVGHYLQAESLLAAGNVEEARKEFSTAVEIERDAHYLDGLGRASESLSFQRNRDLTLQDAALRAYSEATKLDPTLFSPLLGSGRLYVTRREMEKAVPPLLAASKINGEDAEVAYLLGIAYKVLGTKEYKQNAIKWLILSNQLKASADTSNELGLLYQDLGNPAAAIASFKVATDTARDQIKKTGTMPTWYPEAQWQLADLAIQTGDEPTACKAYRAFLGTPDKKTKGHANRVKEANRAIATSLQGVCQ